jgi:pimeloyl-ACP methyl ester carboxylesterase
MKLLVNGVHLYFDVEGAGLRPKMELMVEKPTLILLHGGPGADHTGFKPRFSSLIDVAQVIYLDHRGNGRSDLGSESDWTLSQWADDLYSFCLALGIERPIVYGSSFGGMVAIAYATRHPEHPGKLVLVSTTAQAEAHADAKVRMFARLGGHVAGELAHRRFVLGDTSPEVLRAWVEVALPLYTQNGLDSSAWQRQVLNQQVREWFYRQGGEGRSFDLLARLESVQCETLVLGGVLDPMIPIQCQRDIAHALPADLVEYHEFANCGHGVFGDAGQAAMQVLRDFIERPVKRVARET